MTPTRDDKIAAKLTRMMGIPLSAEEYARGDDLGFDATGGLMPNPKKPPPPMVDEDGTVHMDRVLCQLLNALGIVVPCEEDGDEAAFKHALMTACMAKIQELTGRGRAQGKGSSPAANTNPLIPGNEEPIPAMYMSVEVVTPERVDAATAALLRQMGIHN